MSAAHNRPCAARGLHSYRFRHAHGFVMIGALDHSDAMFQARRSTDATGVLERWNGTAYVPDVTDDMLERFRSHTATESDLRAILADDERAARPCADLRAFLSPILWQLERMDWIGDNLREPVMADAIETLESVEAE